MTWPLCRAMHEFYGLNDEPFLSDQSQSEWCLYSNYEMSKILRGVLNSGSSCAQYIDSAMSQLQTQIERM